MSRLGLLSRVMSSLASERDKLWRRPESSNPAAAGSCVSTAIHQTRICLVTSFPPSKNDLNEYGYHLACAMRDNPEVQLTILADQLPAQTELPGFEVNRCWRFDSMFNVARLLRAIRSAKPHVVWFNIGFSTFARAPVAAFLAITTPALVRLFGLYTHVTLHTVFERIDLRDAGVRWPSLYRAAGRIATRVLLIANDTTVLLPSFRTELLRNYGIESNKVHFRPHGTFAVREHPASAPSEDGGLNVLVFGYWGTYKRLEPVIEAMKLVAPEFPGTKLLIAGMNHPSAPSYLESLRQQHAENSRIEFLGYVPESDLQGLFAKTGVLVLPYSSAAGSSGVVHQGCEYGIPMVAADIPEIRESANAEEIAIHFYPPGDALGLAQQLIALLGSSELRRNLSEHNLLVARSMPLSQVVSDYLDLFETRLAAKEHFREKLKEHQTPTLEKYASIGEWFLHSGIQEGNGGFARYFMSDRGRNAPLSCEITGYAISALIELYKQTGETGYRDAALKAAYFLVVAWDRECSAMPFEMGPEGSKYSYFFDNGIIVRGLLAAWRESGHADLLATAVMCADSMAQDFFDGSDFSPIIELPAKTRLPCEPSRWSKSPGCYQLKAALAWHELWQVTNRERYLDLYLNMLKRSLESQPSFLPESDRESGIMDRLHPYCYFLEGLLPSAHESQCATALSVGIKRTALYVNEISAQFLRSDVVAQLLRTRLFAADLGVLPLDKGQAHKEASTLRQFQSHDSDPRLQGGIWFGRKEGRILPFMNPVSTAFGHQALEMWDQYRNGHRFKWQQLV